MIPRPPWLKKAGIPKTAAQTVNALKIKISQMSAQIKQMQDLIEDLEVPATPKQSKDQAQSMKVTNSTPPKKSKSRYRPEKIADITERRLRDKK